MHKQKNSPKNYQFAESEDLMDLAQEFQESNGIDFEPCGDYDCICADAEFQEIVEEMNALALKAEALEIAMETVSMKLQQKVEATDLKSCPNIPLLNEDSDEDFDDCDEDDDCESF